MGTVDSVDKDTSTLSDLLNWYKQRVKAVGRDAASKELYNLKYNRTVTSILHMLVDENGNEVELKRNVH